jgi:hypothetical protein
MLIEHLYYSIALAVVVGMLSYRFFGRDASWVIVACAFAPDLDYLFDYDFLGTTVTVAGVSLYHGMLHNVWSLLVFAVLAGALLRVAGIAFLEGTILAGIGYAAHLAEDALVYNAGYPFFWPVLPGFDGIGLLPSVRDFYGLANTEVLVIGLLLMLVAMMLRTVVEGPGWVRHYLPGNGTPVRT